MTGIAKLLEHPVALQLGLVLAHFLWQGVVVACLVLLALVALRRARAAVRYAVLLALLAVMAVCPALTFVAIPGDTARAAISRIFVQQPGRAAAPGGTQGAAAARIGAPSGARASPATGHDAGVMSRVWRWTQARLPWITFGWLVGVVVLSLRLLLRWASLSRVRRRAVPVKASTLEGMVRALSRKLQVKRAVRLLQSASLSVPMVIGWLRPAILLPPSLLTGLTPAQLEAVLAHELAHIRRYDYLANLIQTALETVLFYHPAVWWLSRLIRQEREHCCDDLAVAACGDPIAYARALAAAEVLRGRAPALAVAASSGSLLGRVRRLLGWDDPRRRRLTTWAAAAAPVVGILVLALVLQLSTPALAAEARLEYYVFGQSASDADRARFAGVRTVTLVVQGELDRQGEGSGAGLRRALSDVLERAGIAVVDHGPADAEVRAAVGRRYDGVIEVPFDRESTVEWRIHSPARAGTRIVLPGSEPFEAGVLALDEAGPSGPLAAPLWRIIEECARRSLLALLSDLDPGRMRALLRTADREVRLSAFALTAEGKPSPATVELLVQALQDRQNEVAVRMFAARGLGRATSLLEQVTPPLVAALTTRHESPYVRAGAALALGDLALSDESLYTALLPALRDRDPLVRQAAALSLENDLFWGPYHYSVADRAAPALIASLHDGNPGVRWAAAIGLRGVGTPATAVPDLTKLLADREPAVRLAAAYTFQIARPGGASAVPVLARLLTDPDAAMREAAAHALGQMETAGAPAVPALARLLSDPDAAVREQAAEALGEMGPAALPALPAMIKAMHDRTGEENTFDTFIMQALDNLGPKAVPALRQALRDSSPRLREAAAYGLGATGAAAAPAVPALTDLLRDPDGRVGCRAAWALGSIGPAASSAVPALVAAAKSKDSSLRAFALGALPRCGAHDPVARSALLQGLTDENAGVRRTVPDALGRLADSQPRAAVAALARALDDADQEVRSRAAATLGAIGPSAAPAVPALRSLREREPSEAAVVDGALKKILAERP